MVAAGRPVGAHSGGGGGAEEEGAEELDVRTSRWPRSQILFDKRDRQLLVQSLLGAADLARPAV